MFDQDHLVAWLARHKAQPALQVAPVTPAKWPTRIGQITGVNAISGNPRRGVR